MTSFYDLPLELIVVIFEALVDAAHPRDHSAMLKATILVSKDWRNVAESTSALWCTLSNEDSQPWVKRVLRYSGPNGPLNVRFTGYAHRLTIDWFEKMAMPHINRWVDFYIDLPFVSDEGGLSTIAAPRLQRMSIYSRNLKVIPLELFGGQTPQLQYLSLNNQTICWKSETLRSTTLQYLFIYNPIRLFNSVHILSKIIASCPNLVRFAIHGVAFSRLTPGPDRPPVIMTHLTHIELELDIRPTLTIFKRFQFPNIIKVAVEISLSDSDRPLWDDFLKLVTPIFIKLMEKLSKPQVSLHYSRTWVLKVDSGSFVLRTPYPDVACLQPLLSSMGDVPVAVIYLRTPSSPLCNQLSIIDDLARNIVHLRPPPDYTELAEILNEVTGDAPEGSRRILLELRTLELTVGSTWAPSTELLVAIVSVIERKGAVFVMRNQSSCVELGEGLSGLFTKYPDSFVFGGAEEVRWWDRPEVHIDPDYQ